MVFYFDDKGDFIEDLKVLVSKTTHFSNPVIVVPNERDVITAKKELVDANVTFISYDYWLSKKWLLDGNYDHFDFFRVDQFFMSRCYNIKVGKATVKRIKRKVENKEEE